MTTNPYETPQTPNASSQEPVRIKAYGLFSMTKSTYLSL